MDSEAKKRLVVPFIIFLALLAINVNSIVTGINTHNTSRVVIAGGSCALVIVAFIIVIRAVKKGDAKNPDA